MRTSYYEEMKEVSKWLEVNYDRQITMSNNDENDWEMSIRYEIDIYENCCGELCVELTLYVPNEDENFESHDSWEITEKVEAQMRDTNCSLVQAIIQVLKDNDEDIYCYGKGENH